MMTQNRWLLSDTILNTMLVLSNAADRVAEVEEKLKKNHSSDELIQFSTRGRVRKLR